MQMLRTLLGFCLLLGASVAIAQATATQAGMARKDGTRSEAPQGESVSASYKSNRAAFHQQRNSRARELVILDEDIKAQRALLDELSLERQTLQQQLPLEPQGKLEQLRSLTRFLESRVFGVFHPMSALNGSATTTTQEQLLQAGERAANAELPSGYIAGLSNAVSSLLPWPQNPHTYASFLLPLVIVLAVFAIRKRHRTFYDEHKPVLQRGALALVILLPLSSYAQQDTTAGNELASLFNDAEEVLRLSLVQRYIKELSDSKSAGRRIRITGIDLEDSPLVSFKSVVVGSGEYYSTLAALHHADNNPEATLDALLALSAADTRYASKEKDPRSYEALVVAAVRYCLDQQEPGLAEGILREHQENFRDPSVAVALSAELDPGDSSGEPSYDYGLDLGTGFDQETNAAPVALAMGSLNALLSSRPPGAGEVLDSVGNESAFKSAQNAVVSASQYLSDLAQLFSRIDQLGEEGREEEAPTLLDEAITVTSKNAVSNVNGQTLSSTEALQYLSYESFRRGYFTFAEKSVMAAIKPLSVAERRALEMRVPPGAIAQLRVPEPEHLVAPLYLGLLYEKQGRADDARARFEAEGRRAVESLVQSNGLYVPDMMNHLSLLGSVVDPQTESATLEQIDRLLNRLEQETLDELEASTKSAIQERRSALKEAQDTTLQLQTEIADLRGQLAAAEKSGLSKAASTLLLLLRCLALVAVVVLLVTAAVKIALLYAQQRSRYRLSAFWWKLVETLGWVWLLSLLSAPLGLIMVVFAQYFLLNHLRIEANNSHAAQGAENVQKHKNNGVDNAQAGVEGGNGENGGDSYRESGEGREEDPWTNVIQMLRDSKHSDSA